MRSTLVASTLLLTTFGIAQTSTPSSTIPPGYLKTAGETGHWRVFGAVAARDMGVYSPAAAGISKASRAITHLTIRLDESRANLVGFSADVEISLSSKGSKWKGVASGAFDTNHGTDKRVFFKRAKINIPSAKSTQTGPRPWALTFKGAAPFVAIAQEGLIIDYKVYSTRTIKVTNYGDAGRHYANGLTKSYGTGCPSGFTIRSLDHKVDPTRPWYTYAANAGGGDLVVSFLGAAETKIPLPGASCHLYTVPLLFHPLTAKANSSGYTNQTPWTWGKIPVSAANTVLYTQAAAFDASLKIKLSAGLRILFGAGFQAPPFYQSVYGYHSSSRAFDPDKSSAHGASTNSALIFGVN